MGDSKIEWCDKTWSPVTGCTKVSSGCKNCWAERMSKRLAGRCGYPKENPFAVTLHPDKLAEPLRWKKPSRIFVCSMGDLFHKDVPDEFIKQVFASMAVNTQHTFMVLTKRPSRMKEFASSFPEQFDLIADSFTGFVEFLPFLSGRTGNTGSPVIIRHGTWPLPNVYLGVSVEDQQTADERIPLLLQTLAAKRLVSYEPAIGPADFKPYLRIAWQCSYCSRYYPDPLKEVCPDCGKRGGWTGSHIFNPPGGQRGSGLDQIIMGGESGPRARPMHPDWARSVRDQCKAAGVPFFFKQWGEWGITTPPPPEKQHPNYKGLWVCPDAISRMFNKSCPEAVWMEPLGKTRAGCLLDGVEHKEVAG